MTGVQERTLVVCSGRFSFVRFMHAVTLVFPQPPQMGSMMMTQPGLLYSQPGIRQANPFGTNPGAQVTKLFIDVHFLHQPGDKNVDTLIQSSVIFVEYRIFGDYQVAPESHQSKKNASRRDFLGGKFIIQILRPRREISS